MTPDAAAWEAAQRHLCAKALGELAHERLIAPVAVGDEHAVGTWAFRATRHALDHWRVAPASIRRTDGSDVVVEDLVLELLDLSDEVRPVYLEEVNATLASLAARLATARPVAELTGFQQVEAAMTEGHPCFVANSGRLGFGVSDTALYAPESGRSLGLVWLAARRDVADFTACRDTSYDDVAGEECRAFKGRFEELGLDPDDYLLIPVHPWQWDRKLAVSFAGELAAGRLVHLGEHGSWQPQQSVRTFFDPARGYVKTALSVLNMGFTRGLSADYMRVTPAINDWLADLLSGDEELDRCRFGLLRERAAVGYRHAGYEVATSSGSPYRKMLAALWRESPLERLGPGESVVTMASLLHVDPAGDSFAVELVRRSGLPADLWLRRYLEAYLVPVLHCLARYDLAFMPHGENVILVLRDGAVDRVLFKDLAEEIALMDPAAQLPEEVRRIQVQVPHDVRLLSVFTDVVDCFLRFLGPLLSPVLREEAFWAAVGDVVRDWQRRHPHLAERYDLFQPEVALSCLNRLQLRNNTQMVDLGDPAGSLVLVGTLPNPLATAAATPSCSTPSRSAPKR